MLIGHFIAPLLYVTGAITALPVLQFFFPGVVIERLIGVRLQEEAAILIARHWGLVTLTLGALLVYAAMNPAARPAILLAVLVEKLGFAFLALSQWKRFPKLRGAGLFDLACSLLYGAYLLGG